MRAKESIVRLSIRWLVLSVSGGNVSTSVQRDILLPHSDARESPGGYCKIVVGFCCIGYIAIDHRS
jgi:hypothetical protein